MEFDVSFNESAVRLTLRDKRAGLLSRLIAKKSAADLQHLPIEERDLLFAIADLRAIASEIGIDPHITSNEISLDHRLAAALDAKTSEAFGLPPVVDLVLKTDVEGMVGATNFRLKHEWLRNGQRQNPKRTGSMLETSAGLRRVPLWMMDAIETSEAHRSGKGDSEDWEALARFRRMLDPGVDGENKGPAARLSMTDFLSGLEVRLADQFSISPKNSSDFEIVPFSSRRLERDLNGFDEISEDMGEIKNTDLSIFQTRVRERGALPAYRLSPGRYLVVDRSAAPALKVMAEMQRAPASERSEFILNPGLKISNAVEASLRSQGKLDGLTPQAEQEMIEAAAGNLLVETKEFSERVTGVVTFEKVALDIAEPSGTTWLPEEFSRKLGEILGAMPREELSDLRERVASAIEQEQAAVEVGELSLPARPEMLSVIEERLSAIIAEGEKADSAVSEPKRGPIVLETAVNFEELSWYAKLTPRSAALGSDIPPAIKTPLKPHQVDSLKWQIEAWRAGLPGILNADEQGLGKTLQTIAFLVWLKSQMAENNARNRGPVLVVAPTSLLENWEQEVVGHVHDPGLGHLIRLYGSSLGGRKAVGAKGRDTDTGEAKLDLSSLHEAIDEGRAHRFWLLTTYTTLTNYQHSLGRIPFSTVVFDEIQALKNPVSLRAVAARAMNADFRIGLTGTPIENAATDLWSIMDQLAAGSLDSLRDFHGRYRVPTSENMSDLHSRVFRPNEGCPPLALRRIKDDVASDLPKKSRKIHPRLMPDGQAIAYDDAKLKLATGGLGAQLKMLHHIRTVSVHPSMQAARTDEDFISASGRLTAVMDILRRIHAKDERALVFIEHRQMQYRFVELVRAEFKLQRVDLINGETPIPQRQAIVNRFQQHLGDDRGFDLLVLGPKAAGTGLTLTAATHVIHLSRWWNPAVEEQCNDRVHRIGQTQPVTIHIPMAIHSSYREQSFDCLLQSLMMRKRRLASSALWPMGDTEDDVAALQSLIKAEKSTDDGDALSAAMRGMFERDNLKLPTAATDGSLAVD
ncbi:DEAD/DEAH box helicase [Rhizobium leguminosarum]|uniref:DEAD/DEAH box helicase n=1 Tax=Rhizobium leguminosarum TaxID=384 RepID=UPI00103BAE38|nr:DEAD/DEAH box helicase [Rhizobium leguminosarum]MBY5478303.1 DEAD/DEAH box helicase [Rhizobium leguminosarum]TBZ56458.1 DEAD/DEAH box helicase [Rhizobium leguminosarum bv. viciae]